MAKIRINGQIRGIPNVRVIGSSGDMLGVMTVAQALRAALAEGLDLVEVNPSADPPVCKILDLGKYDYEAKRRAAEARRDEGDVAMARVEAEAESVMIARMSVDLSVYLQRTKMLSPLRWAEAIRSGGFALDLDVDFDVDAHTGYLPCRYDGAESGFEYYASELTDDDRVGLELAPSFDFSVTFTTHADLREFETSAIAAAVLAHATGGLLCDPQSGETFQPDGALAWAREQIAEIRKHRR